MKLLPVVAAVLCVVVASSHGVLGDGASNLLEALREFEGDDMLLDELMLGLRQTSNDGDVRLVGPSASEGRVEVYYSNRWNSMCMWGGGWEQNVANVVCRKLGYGTADKDKSLELYSINPNADQQPTTWMDNVYCNGKEDKLTDCYYEDYTGTDPYCSAEDVARVSCNAELKPYEQMPVSPLGLESGDIPDSSLSASSEFGAMGGARLCRVNLVRTASQYGGWIAARNDKNQWVQVDLGAPYLVYAVGTQGRQDALQWVKTYKVAYSMDGVNFDTVTAYGADKIFRGNSYNRRVERSNLREPILCRYVRIMPVSWYGHISMRMEIYGKGPVVD